MEPPTILENGLPKYLVYKKKKRARSESKVKNVEAEGCKEECKYYQALKSSAHMERISSESCTL